MEPVYAQVRQLGGDILRSERFRLAAGIPHHGRVSVARHSLHVAQRSLEISRWLNRHRQIVQPEDAVRAALLHDIGMTEPQVSGSPSWRKAYTHPRQGSRIAGSEFGANEIQRNAVLRHMWPICGIPPRHLAGWVVLAADKLCTLQELRGR